MHFNIETLLRRYGYEGIFLILFLEVVGIPFPAETTLIISGIEWSKGVFSLLPLILWSSFGNITGSVIGYWIGRLLGRPIVLRYGRFVGISEERLQRAETRFGKYRIPVVLFGKFIAGIRVLIPYVAGMGDMPFPGFSLYNTVSAFAWSFTFLVMGKYIGIELRRYHHVMHRILLPAIIIGAIATGVYLWLRARKKRKRSGD